MAASFHGNPPAWLLDVLACPRCGGALTCCEETTLRCDACGQRYPTRPHLDLLPPGKRPPNEGPGDTAAMARRRLAWERRVDSAGAPPCGERAALERYLDTILARLRPGALVLDLGCGTSAVLRLLGERYPAPLRLLGLDIALPMLDASYRALRGEPRAAVVRASTRRRLPLHDGTVDLVLRRLAPALVDEVRRVLAGDGAYVTASFGPTRWHEVYDALPGLPRPKVDGASLDAALAAQGFVVVAHHVWRGVETVTPEGALERLLMGPAAFHVDRERDLPRLHALATRQGTPGRLRLTTHDEVVVGVKTSF